VGGLEKIYFKQRKEEFLWHWIGCRGKAKKKIMTDMVQNIGGRKRLAPSMKKDL
jgi:hypothetical protein